MHTEQREAKKYGAQVLSKRQRLRARRLGSRAGRMRGVAVLPVGEVLGMAPKKVQGRPFWRFLAWSCGKCPRCGTSAPSGLGWSHFVGGGGREVCLF